MMIIKRLGLAAAFVLFAGVAQAAIVDFEDVAMDGTNPIVTSTTSGGFLFSSAHHHDISAPGLFGGADNGTQYIGEEDGGLGGDITMSAVSGGAFNLNGFDAAELFVTAPAGFPNATSIMVTGILSGGGSVSQTVTLDGIIDGAGGLPDFETFLLTGFTNIVSATFSGLTAAGTGGLAIDNMNVGAVPVPASVLLLLSGVAGLSFVGRRKRRSA